MCKKVYIRTLGCQMNNRDSELVTGLFLSNGYELTADISRADVILFNTCSVRQHAEDKVFSELGTLKRLKITNPNKQITNNIQYTNSKLQNKQQTTNYKLPIIGVIGCMAKNLGGEIIKRIPHVDLVIGPNDLGRIYDYVRVVQKERQSIVAVDSQQRDKTFYKNLHHQDKRYCYVNISEGCSNFCSYCVVPYVRGRHRSRPVKNILREVKQLVDTGISSITLLGQNVNDYQSFKGKKKIDFVNLLDMISDIKGVKELSFVTSHPKDIDFRLFDLMAKKKNIKKYLHLPVQSGSNRILKLMNRRYTREKYLKIIAQYRKKVPNGVLATDVIVGFPTETEKDFGDTLDLIKKIQFNFAYIFKYSPRPHTKASNMVDDLPTEIKKRRHKILLDLQKKISKAKSNSKTK